MALQTYNFTSSGPGYRANLGTTDDVYVGINGLLSSSDSRAIYGTGSNHSAEIHGAVAGHDGGILLGNSGSLDSGENVFVADTATVSSNLYSGVLVQAYDSRIENNGVIRGGYGVWTEGINDLTTSTLINRGKIDLSVFTQDAVHRQGTEDFNFVNKGQVLGHGHSAYDGFSSSGDQTINNAGKIGGTIAFGTGNDVYKGGQGQVTGVVTGGDGDDRMTGGVKNEKFEGDAGHDIMKGGAGADTFIYKSVNDSTVAETGRDLIVGFKPGEHDKIDLSAIDAKLSTVTDDQFDFIGTANFDHHEGQLRYYNSAGHAFIEGDTNGDGTADFSIELGHTITLHEEAFAL